MKTPQLRFPQSPRFRLNLLRSSHLASGRREFLFDGATVFGRDLIKRVYLLVDLFLKFQPDRDVGRLHVNAVRPSGWLGEVVGGLVFFAIPFGEGDSIINHCMKTIPGTRRKWYSVRYRLPDNLQ